MPNRILDELTATQPGLRGGVVANPMVSFLCMTYGRVATEGHLLNEMVYWFTRQTYPDRELLILNDASDQKIVCQTPGVSIINYPIRIPTLGQKRNLLVMKAAGSICLPQDDDDISLPWRAEQAVAMLAEYEYWNPHLWWYAEEGKEPEPSSRGVGHNCSAFRRSRMLGRYQPVNKGDDALAEEYAVHNLKCNPRRIEDPQDISYFYRWGVSRRHISGFHDMDEAYNEFDQGPPGTYEIFPAIQRDYVKIHEDLTNQSKR